MIIRRPIQLLILVLVICWFGVGSIARAQETPGCCVITTNNTCKTDLKASECKSPNIFLPSNSKCVNVPACAVGRIISPSASTGTAAGTATNPSPVLRFTPNVPIPGLFDKTVDVDNSLLAKYISAFYIFFAGVAGILAVVVMMWGGFHYITSAGNSQKISQAKEIISNAIIGLILVFTSYLLLNTINPNLTRLTLPTLSSVQTIYQSTIYCEAGGPSSPGMQAAAAQNARCGAKVAFTDNNVQKSCISLAVDPSEEARDIACFPFVNQQSQQVEYRRMEAEKICEDNSITPDNGCTNAQGIFVYQSWLKGGCKQGNIGWRPTNLTGHDKCIYGEYFACPSLTTAQVICSVAGTATNSTCWRDGKPRVLNKPESPVGERLECIDPSTANKPVADVDAACCQLTQKTDIICSVFNGCALDEVQLSTEDCTRYGLDTSSKFIARDRDGETPNAVVQCIELGGTHCCAPLRLYYSSNDYTL